MKAVHKVNKGKTMSAATAVGFGTGMCIFISGLIAAVTALLINSEKIPQESVGIASVFTHLIASALGCLTAVILCDRMPAIVSGVTCAVYFVLLLGVNILLMDGQFSGVGGGVIAIAIGGILSLLPTLIKRKGKKQKRPRFG